MPNVFVPSRGQCVDGQCGSAAIPTSHNDHICLRHTRLDAPYSVTGAFGGAKMKQVRFNRGDFTLAQQGVQSSSRVESSGAIVFMSMTPGYREKIGESLGAKVNLDEPRTATAGLLNAPLYAQLIKDFVQSGGQGRTLRAESLITLLSGDAIRVLDQRPGNSAAQSLSDPALATVKEYIEAHLAEKISIKDLANLAHVSQYHFARRFKIATGRSPHQFVLSRRLEEVKALLTMTKKPLVEIAYESGFSSQSHMTEAFRKHFGTPPASYRNQL